MKKKHECLYVSRCCRDFLVLKFYAYGYILTCRKCGKRVAGNIYIEDIYLENVICEICGDGISGFVILSDCCKDHIYILKYNNGEYHILCCTCLEDKTWPLTIFGPEEPVHPFSFNSGCCRGFWMLVYSDGEYLLRCPDCKNIHPYLTVVDMQKEMRTSPIIGQMPKEKGEGTGSKGRPLLKVVRSPSLPEDIPPDTEEGPKS